MFKAIIILFCSIYPISVDAIEIYGLDTLNTHTDESVQVAFSPKGEVQQLIIQTLDQAKHQILLKGGLFTSKAIGQALLRAKGRGVDVKLLLASANIKLKYGQLRFFSRNNIPTWLDNNELIQTSNICIIDAQTVITGGFQFTAISKKANTENVIVLRNNKTLADVYANDWVQHAMHSKKYQLSVKHAQNKKSSSNPAKKLYNKQKDKINQRLKEKETQYVEKYKQSGQNILDRIF